VATVIRLTRRSNRETVLILQALLSRAVRGEVADLALCFKDSSAENWVFTGVYKASPAQAVNAAARMTWRLSEKQEGS
jgi:hypothetical protein